MATAGAMRRARSWPGPQRPPLGDRAHMLLRVNRPNAGTGFPDSTEDRPIVSSEWKSYEIRGEVAPNAGSIRIGVALYGRGRVSVSGVEPRILLLNSLARLRQLGGRDG